MYYDDPEYAAKRLNDTLVRLNTGEGFYVIRVCQDPELCSGPYGVYGRKLSGGSKEWFTLDNIDLTPVPLGFVNTTYGMVFVCRRPMRKDWKQGLSFNSMITYGPVASHDLSFELLQQTINNAYPTLERSVAELESKKKSMAFSRDFGLSKREDNCIHLIYRKYDVGTMASSVPRLSPKYSFLQQHLDEVIYK
jgi:hypothetical protein